MATSKEREMHRRQRRVKKLRKLKTLYRETKDLADRQVIIEKIKKISVNPLVDLADLQNS